MSLFMKRFMCLGVVALFGLGLGRAALSRFQEKEQAIFAACGEQLRKLGLPKGALKAKYPTPEIRMVSSGCLPPGGTGEVVVKGKFAPETKFVFENDNLEVIKESLVGGEYRATLKVAPAIGPQTAAVLAISPVTGISTRYDNAATVGGKYEWTINAANGWKIVARSPAGKTCGGRSTEEPYELRFYRKGETNSFEKRRADLYFSVYENTNYRFSISQQDPETLGEVENMQSLMKKFADPNLTSAQRNELMKRIETMQAQMQANLSKLADASNVQKMAKQQEERRQEFGCERIDLQVQGGSFTGQMRCSEKVGARIDLTGTVKFVGL